MKALKQHAKWQWAPPPSPPADCSTANPPSAAPTSSASSASSTTLASSMLEIASTQALPALRDHSAPSASTPSSTASSTSKPNLTTSRGRLSLPAQPRPRSGPGRLRRCRSSGRCMGPPSRSTTWTRWRFCGSCGVKGRVAGSTWRGSGRWRVGRLWLYRLSLFVLHREGMISSVDLALELRKHERPDSARRE